MRNSLLNIYMQKFYKLRIKIELLLFLLPFFVVEYIHKFDANLIRFTAVNDSLKTKLDNELIKPFKNIDVTFDSHPEKASSLSATDENTINIHNVW